MKLLMNKHLDSYQELKSSFPKPDKYTLVLLRKTGFFDRICTHIYGGTKFRF